MNLIWLTYMCEYHNSEAEVCPALHVDAFGNYAVKLSLIPYDQEEGASCNINAYHYAN